MFVAFALGWLLGYLGTIPAAGPLAVLVVAASLRGRSRHALRLAAGGAVAEGIWAFAAARGLGYVLDAHPAIERALRVGGGALAIAMGLAIALAAPPKDESAARERAASSVLTGFVLVAFNPSFLASWLASCALLRAHPALATAVTREHAPFLAVGAVAGVVGWFATLDALIRRYRGRLAAWHRRLVRGLGWTLAAVGVIALARGVLRAM